MAGKKESVFMMVLVLTITCVVAGVCLSFTYAKTKDAIDQAEVNAKIEVVRQVLPDIDGEPEVKQILINGVPQEFYIGKKAGVIVGVATESAGSGYGGSVTMLVGVDPSGAIVGIKLLQHKETPGLGTKAGEPGFLNQFMKKTLPAASDSFRVTKDGGDIQGITAATITSRAVAEGATKALRMFMEHKEEVLA